MYEQWYVAHKTLPSYDAFARVEAVAQKRKILAKDDMTRLLRICFAIPDAYASLIRMTRGTLENPRKPLSEGERDELERRLRVLNEIGPQITPDRLPLTLARSRDKRLDGLLREFGFSPIPLE